VVYDAPLDVRRKQVQFVAMSFSKRKMQVHVANMVKEAQDAFAAWPSEGVIDLLEVFSRLIILTASRCLMGKEIRETLFEEVASIYHDLDAGITPISVFLPNLPIPAHKRRDKARLEMDKIFGKIIRARREHPEIKHDDILQDFMDCEIDGVGFTDEQIVGLLVVLLFAGQHTSAITSTWTAILVLRHPEIFGKVMEEQSQVPETLDYECLMKMNYLGGCISEALRLYPPIILMMRKVLQTTRCGEFTIPEGHIAVTSPAVTGRLSEFWPNPEQFDPLRYQDADTSEIKHAFIPFGAGRHACMGRRFAYLQVKAILSLLFRQFDLQMISDLPKPNYSGLVVGPTPPCLASFKRKQTTG